MLTLTRPQPTVHQLHPILFAPRTWEHLLHPERARPRCDHCHGYMWLDVDRRGHERLVCSQCGEEAES